ncbi:MAG: hypothetical protein KIS94_00075 [Chitinophagales bacterium]|nr:hypothetical protein [Chitinophagales bacterium]
MIKLFFGNHNLCNSFSVLVNSFDAKDLATHTRSTVPLLCYWSNYAAGIKFYFNNLGLKQSQDINLHFEYQVPSIQSAKSSFTDLFICTIDTSIAIEAKYTEPRYKPCKVWISRGEKPSYRELVLQHWLDLISEVTGNRYSPSMVADIPYQMIHRTASACCMPDKKNIMVVYQLFAQQSGAKKFYGADLARLKQILGNSPFIRFCIHEVKSSPRNLQPFVSVKSAILQSGPYSFGAESFSIL